MLKERKTKKRISSFSMILVMTILMTIGVAVIPLLSIQYTPSIKERSVSLYVNWPGTSSLIIEQEVTSKLEGVLVSIPEIKSIRSVSRQGNCRITMQIKEKASIDYVRFEISSAVRRIYSKLPQGVSYPWLSVSTSGERTTPIITYTINGDASTGEIKQYIENDLLHRISSIPGVAEARLSGANGNYLEVLFQADALRSYGISVRELSAALASYTGLREDVGIISSTDAAGNPTQLYAALVMSTSKEEIGAMPIKNIKGRLVTLADVAGLTLRKKLPDTYSRINGLNMINISVFAEKQVNTLKVIQQVKEMMAQSQELMPAGFGMVVADDSSIFIKQELDKIVLRTVLALIILLLFTLIATRKLTYLLVIALSLAANILISFICYALLGIELHLYSLAGITVSLGIIIDTSIIMIDHYGYYRNRKAFLSILAALLTTIGALSIVLFLPERQRTNLIDFSAVIIISLTIAMVTALLFIPALLDKLQLHTKPRQKRLKQQRRIVRFTYLYGRFIACARRYRWAFILFALLGFGLPLYLLPDRLKPQGDQELSRWENLYNATFGSTLYQQQIKPISDVALGGSMRLFANSLQSGSYYREPERTRLYINAGMPEGCTVHQLNEVMQAMERFLSRFPEIDLFKTEITDYNQGTIQVLFKKEAERSGFPFYLKSAVIAEAINFGGANWSVYGVDETGFNNNIGMIFKPFQIQLTGYNYDQLYRYARQLVDTLSTLRRVSDPEIYGSVTWGEQLSRNEFFIDLDARKSSLAGVSPQGIFSTLEEQLYNQPVGRYFDGSEMMEVRLVSDHVSQFDSWHLQNSYLSADGKQILFPQLANIAKRRSGNDIYREDQQYQLFVAFDFIGPPELAKRVTEEQCLQINERLPLGYNAEVNSIGWNNNEQKQNYLLILLIIVIIYFICAILFESLLQPLAIISLIPISFIGVFLTFSLTGYRFDQGGFAAFVLLSGLIVNAGIYLINEYNTSIKNTSKRGLSLYLRAFNHKIIPILLTILSTILGLIPFLYEGESEVFWFSFALGTMGGMVFSVIAFYVYLPLFMRLKP